MALNACTRWVVETPSVPDAVESSRRDHVVLVTTATGERTRVTNPVVRQDSVIALGWDGLRSTRFAVPVAHVTSVAQSRIAVGRTAAFTALVSLVAAVIVHEVTYREPIVQYR